MAEGKFGPGRGFGEGLFADGGESVRALVEEVVQALIGEEAEEHFGAPWNAKGLPRPNGYRNGLKGRCQATSETDPLATRILTP